MMHLFRVVNFLCLQAPPSNDQGRNEGQSTTRGQGGDDRNDNVWIYHGPYGGVDEPTWNRNEGGEVSDE